MRTPIRRWPLPALTWLLFIGLATPALAADGKLPWKAGDEPPAIAGVALGDSREHIETLLGKAPETRAARGGVALLYVERGVVVMLNAQRQAAVVYLLTAAAGTLDGVRVGDARDTVLRRWGEPTAVQGAQALYLAGDWAVIVELGEGQAVTQLSVSRVFGDLDAT